MCNGVIWFDSMIDGAEFVDTCCYKRLFAFSSAMVSYVEPIGCMPRYGAKSPSLFRGRTQALLDSSRKCLLQALDGPYCHGEIHVAYITTCIQ